VTATLRLHGWQLPTDDSVSHRSLYGSDLPAVEELSRDHPEWSDRLHPALPYTPADIVWGARHESARTIEDVLSRRTRALFLDARASIDIAPRVAQLLAQELGHDRGWEAEQVKQFRNLAAGYMVEGSE
jgi:glycerol-3-phosphate dehydrogenase